MKTTLLQRMIRRRVIHRRKHVSHVSPGEIYEVSAGYLCYVAEGEVYFLKQLAGIFFSNQPSCLVYMPQPKAPKSLYVRFPEV